MSIYDGVGEANVIAVEPTAAGVRISDAGADLEIVDVETCSSESARVVVCEGTFEDGVSIWGGDGDDDLRGGPADDTLGGGAGADILDGGAGRDTVDYSDHADGITVDLTRAGGQGADGDNDSVLNVENLVGGPGADVLIGNGMPNLLRGAAGRDKLRGAGGNDTILGDGFVLDPPADISPESGLDDADGGDGNDRIDVGTGSVARGGPGDDTMIGYRSRVFGGAGADVIQSARGYAYCGAGGDTVRIGAWTGLVARGEHQIFVARDCERVEPFPDDTLVVGPPRRRGHRMLVRMSCTSISACDGQIGISQGGRVIGKRRFQLAINRPRVLRLSIRRSIGSGPVRVTLSHVWDDPPFRYDTRL